jgi:hypothetical protein
MTKITGYSKVWPDFKGTKKTGLEMIKNYLMTTVIGLEIFNKAGVA